jgi:hypothetical protein
MLPGSRSGPKLLWKREAFTVTALLTPARYIGANTAHFHGSTHAGAASPGRLATKTFLLTHTDCSSKTILLYASARLFEA